MEHPPHWLVWQLADSAFPSGGFAHSGGLEAAAAQKIVRNPGELQGFCEQTVSQACAATLPIVRAVHRSPERYFEADTFTDTTLSNHVASRASRAQGQALLSAAGRIFSLPGVGDAYDAVRREVTPGHLAPAFGLVTASLAIAAEDADRLLLFSLVRTVVSSAVRLNLIGPVQAQQLQHRLGPFTERTLQRTTAADLDAVCQTAPLPDLAQANQDRLYSRLFQS